MIADQYRFILSVWARCLFLAMAFADGAFDDEDDRLVNRDVNDDAGWLDLWPSGLFLERPVKRYASASNFSM